MTFYDKLIFLASSKRRVCLQILLYILTNLWRIHHILYFASIIDDSFP